MVTVEHKDQTAFAVWITGLPASGKSTVTRALVRQLNERGIHPAVLESDTLRKIFSTQPSYDEQDREYFYGAIAFIGRVLTEHGIPVIFDATANLRSYRDRARLQIPNFIEVFVDSPLQTCIERDPKHIYKDAAQGRAAHVPGLQVPYEPPIQPDVVIFGDREDPEDAAKHVITTLNQRHFVAIRGNNL
ncbi:MAG TPA: adenylyl-sulfate kinase [Terriglobia bacterium]|nr:adenylyl-sulfate kinase [Terriglobia bacterium]